MCVKNGVQYARKKWSELKSLVSTRSLSSDFKLSNEDEKVLFGDLDERVEDVEMKWSEIEAEILLDSTSLGDMKLSLKKDVLKNLLEGIREDVDSLLGFSYLLDSCKAILERLLTVSENLRVSYVFPGYVESFYILDTLKIAERTSNNR